MTSPQPHPTQWTGQPAPGYGQQDPGYGQPIPRPRQPPPGYGRSVPGPGQAGTGQQPWYGDPRVPAGLPQPYPGGWAGDRPAAGRPGTLLAGVVMTYIGAGLMVVFGVGLPIGATSSAFMTGFTSGSGARGAALGVLGVVALIPLAFSAVLVVLAVLTQQGRGGARIALTVIGGIVLLLDLAGVATRPNAVTVINLLWVAVAVALLWVGQANAWFHHMAYARGQGW